MITPPDLIMESDASLKGWGATCRGQTIQGHWTLEEQKDQINALELRAIFLAIKGLLGQETDLHLLVKADNKTAVAHINKMGGTHSPKLVGIAKTLWEFCLERRILLTAEYLPGTLNVTADRLSREVPESSDWQLDLVMFRDLNAGVHVRSIFLQADGTTN